MPSRIRVPLPPARCRTVRWAPGRRRFPGPRAATSADPGPSVSHAPSGPCGHHAPRGGAASFLSASPRIAGSPWHSRSPGRRATATGWRRCGGGLRRGRCALDRRARFAAGDGGRQKGRPRGIILHRTRWAWCPGQGSRRRSAVRRRPGSRQGAGARPRRRAPSPSRLPGPSCVPSPVRLARCAMPPAQKRSYLTLSIANRPTSGTPTKER